MSADELARLYKQRIERLEPELRQTMGAFGTSAVRLTKEIMTREIYSIPEDRTGRGEARFQRFLRTRRPGQVFAPRKGDRKWVRTGHLRRSERFEVRGSGLAMEMAVVNDANYAEPRHEAGKPGRRKINPQRESHWRDDMHRLLDPLFQEAIAEAVRDVMREGNSG